VTRRGGTEVVDAAQGVGQPLPAVRTYGTLDIMVNNAGIGYTAPLQEITEAQFRRMIDVNLLGVFFGCKHAMGIMKAKRSGVILNTSSAGSFAAVPNTAAYASTKGAVNVLTRDLDIFSARTFLFVPGDRPDRFHKAAASGADVVVLDLEDAVAPARKDEARERVRAWLDAGHPSAVRLNAVGAPWHADDIAMITGYHRAAPVVMIPKAEEPEELESLSRTLPAGTRIIPLIETAAGITRAALLCAVAKVVRPAFGSVDLAAQLGVDYASHDALRYSRSALVLAAAAAGCAGPIDGVTTSLADESSLRADLEHAIALGFTAKLCIHPRQVAVANHRLTPSHTDVEWAAQVVAAAGDGSVTVLDGQMIDRPVLARARAILARASGNPSASHTSEG